MWRSGKLLRFFIGKEQTVRKESKSERFRRVAEARTNKTIAKIDSMLRSPNCPFVLFVGTKKLVKRKEFEDYISRKLVI